MTRDEVMALTDDELQREVAKAQGWRVRYVGTGQCSSAPDDYRGYLYVAQHRSGPFSTKYRISEAEVWQKDIPDYPRDIAAAMSLRQALQSENRNLHVNVHWQRDGSGEIEVWSDIEGPLVYVEFPAERFEWGMSCAYLIAKGVSE